MERRGAGCSVHASGWRAKSGAGPCCRRYVVAVRSSPFVRNETLDTASQDIFPDGEGRHALIGMAKQRIVYSCAQCGASTPQWRGQCPDCGAWNSLVESIAETGGARSRTTAASDRPIVASSVDLAPDTRVETGLSELNRVLGGGLVAGAVVLVGGEPGIGKSTLLLQVLAGLAGAAGSVGASADARALYVTGEESIRQVALRAKRLQVAADRVQLLAETRMEAILDVLAREAPRIVVVDSIQTMFTDALQSAPGSVAQVRESAARLVRHAKEHAVSVLLVGHVTKDGALAGPRVLEHMVDTVLYFESEADRRFRIIRAVKNRFGAANEIGLFAMTEKGLREVRNPSAIFLARGADDVAGSVVTVVREGTRPLLVELQALVDEASGPPRRLTVGIDQSRLNMLLAVLHRHAGISTQGLDVYANVVGGVRIAETGADLAILAAVRSTLNTRPVDRALVVYGEVGLAGEIRPIPRGEERVREAAKHGFTRALVPAANVPRHLPGGIEVVGVERVEHALELV